MEVVAPVLGFGAIIMFIAAGIIGVRFVSSRIPPPRSSAVDQAERDQLLEDLQARVAELETMRQRMVELEERVDFAERLLAQRRDAPRLGQGPS